LIPESRHAEKLGVLETSDAALVHDLLDLEALVREGRAQALDRVTVPEREIRQIEERYLLAAEEAVDVGDDRSFLAGRDPQQAGDQHVDAGETPVCEVACELCRLRLLRDDVPLEREHALELGPECVRIQDRCT